MSFANFLGWQVFGKGSKPNPASDLSGNHLITFLQKGAGARPNNNCYYQIF